MHVENIALRPETTPGRVTQVISQGAQSNSLTLRASDVARKLKSFDHFLYVWGTKGGYYLPPKSALTWHYISQVLAGEKKLVRLDQVGHVQELPRAKGYLINDLWEASKDLNDLHQYLPDITPSSRVPRTYFLNVGSVDFACDHARCLC